MSNRRKPLELESVRIDKWLWAARFFKTRSIAKSAVEKGQVRIDSTKVKPSRMVKVGTILAVQQGYAKKTITILKLSEHRKGAPEAAELYQESEESLEARELTAIKRRSAALAAPHPTKKPTKKERRQLIQFNGTQPP